MPPYPVIQITYQGINNKTEFTYSPTGGRVKIVETVSGSVTSTKQFIGGEERDGSGVVTKQFFSRGQRNGSTNYFYSRDHLRSVRTTTDNSGVSVSERAFDPFGRLTVYSETVAPDFGFAGMYNHARSGLTLTRFRGYNPVIGRFLSRDPIGESGGVNLNTYADNSPSLFTDPLGLEVRVYTSPAFWGLGIGRRKAQHVFAFSTRENIGAGRGGMFGRDFGRKGYPSGFDAASSGFTYRVVEPDANGTYGGRSERQFIEFLASPAAGLNDGMFIPGLNDCHNSLSRGFKRAGVAYPGSPLGRVGTPQPLVPAAAWGWHTSWLGASNLDSAAPESWGWHMMWQTVDVGTDGDFSDSNISAPFPHTGLQWLMN